MFASILTRKFNPNHDEKGKFSPTGHGISGGARNHLHEMFERISHPDGGFTYQPTTEEEPKEGYALSPYPEKSFAKPVNEFGFKDLVAYYLKNQEAFKEDDHFIGAWHDPASHNIFLDVSVVKHSEEEAIKLALEKDQIAYFDLKNFKSVTANPDAKSGVLKNGKETGTVLGEVGRGFGIVFANRVVQEADGARPNAGRTGRSKGDTGKQPLAHLIAQVFKRNDNHDPKNGQFASNSGGPSESPVRSSGGEGKGISLRPQQPDAESADLIHYGNTGGLAQLSANHYGTGIKGQEAARLSKSTDSSIKQRVYFYLNDGSGKLPRKEQGLGQHVYSVKLTNLYDFKKDPAKIIPRMREIADQTDRSNFMESEIVKAGYDGYALKAYNMAVVLGKDVPVQYKGTDTKKSESLFSNVFKFNPHHDDKGRFATTGGIASSELRGVLKDMRNNPDQHPNIMNMVVDGKKPFGGDTNLGIPRADMPQIPQSERSKFIASLPTTLTTHNMNPMDLKPTQDELDGFKVGKIFKKLKDGDSVGEPILVSKDNYIIDGHHHWGAAVAAKVSGFDKHAKIRVYQLQMGHQELLDAAKAYAKAHGFESKDITKAESMFALIFKHNPYHDEKGRFATGDGAKFISLWGKGYAKAFQAANQSAQPVAQEVDTGKLMSTPPAPAKEVTTSSAEAQFQLQHHVDSMLGLQSKISDHYYWKSNAEAYSTPMTDDEIAFKDHFDKAMEMGKITDPKGDVTANGLQIMDHFYSLSSALKAKMGLPMTEDEKTSFASVQKEIKASQAYNAGMEYQKAMQNAYTEKLKGNAKGFQAGIAVANEAKAKAKEMGLEQYSLDGYEENAKSNAEWEFKDNQKVYTQNLVKAHSDYHAFVRAGKKLKPSSLDDWNQQAIDSGYLTKEQVDQIAKEQAGKATALSDFHKSLKAMIPAAKAASAEFDGRTFKKIDPYSMESEEFFQHGKEVYKTLSDSSRSVVREYTSSGYKQNKPVGLAVTKKMLGLSPELTESTKRFISAMDEATSNPIGKDMVLARNFPTKFMLEQMGTSHAAAIKLDQPELDKMFVGKLYRDTTYGSTSVNTNFNGTYSAASAEGEGKMTIRAPSSTKGIAVEYFTSNSGEHEVILQRGTTYLIRSVSKDGYGRLNFDVDIIGQHPDKLD